MRALVVCWLSLLAAGCQGLFKVPPCCSEACPPCPAEAPATRCETAPAAHPRVEVRPAEDVHVTAPAPKAYVNMPQAPEGAAPPCPTSVGAAPQQPPPTYGAQPPQPMMPVSYGAAPQAPPSYGAGIPLGLVTALVQSSGHHRIALGLDWIEIPIPIPRIFSVPGEQTVTMTQPQMTVAGAGYGAAPPMMYGAPPVYQAPPPMVMPMYGAPPPQPPPCGADKGYGQAPPPGKDARDAQALKESLDACEKKLQKVEKMLKEQAREAEGKPD
jgi:hypothetical protein